MALYVPANDRPVPIILRGARRSSAPQETPSDLLLCIPASTYSTFRATDTRACNFGYLQHGGVVPCCPFDQNDVSSASPLMRHIPPVGPPRSRRAGQS
jgi:hypothetical protein